MSSLHLVPIVEGHGEAQAVPVLLRRLWYELLVSRTVERGHTLEVLTPIRRPRGNLVRREGLENALVTAQDALAEVGDERSMVLLLLDADHDLPCELAPQLLRMTDDIASNLDVACVLPKPEYEVWLIAGNPSGPEDPEARGLGKKSQNELSWQQLGRPYKTRVDQARWTHRLDLGLAHRRSPSFDKLVRELEKRLP